MSVVINGDTGISGVNGSAANPAIKGGDADTGIHFGANTAAITTGGTERVSVDSSGAATFSGTVKTSKVENANTSNGGLEIDTAGHVKLDGQQYPTEGPLSHRNLVINGAMEVAQRSTSLTVTSAGYRSIDRMRFSANSLGVAQFLMEQSTDAPPGFSKSLKSTTTTAETLEDDHGLRFVEYRLEGQDLQHLQFGTAAAKSLTLSFYVKTSVAGDYCISLTRQESTTRLITATYTIAAGEVNTWVYRTITFPGDTAGSAITDDNARRVSLYFIGGGGPNFQGTDSTSWMDYVSGGFNNGQSVQLQTILNATWQVTGIQLEVGEIATPFEHEKYCETLVKCQRYYQQITNSNTQNARTYAIGSFNANRGFGGFPLITSMRVDPAVSFGNLRFEEYSLADSYDISAIAAYGDMQGGTVSLDCRTATNVLTSNQIYVLRFDGSDVAADRGFIQFSAEL